ncbi:hypothetical protein QUB80_24350 [Chlorogloeopsis sp. ULAP01]|uniref:hypothetical protein n=1 Tax=Chlorogloeopsis sp. ULAP01 TaxID=3056483 RepID=UPI0025AAAB96|nr:hypothetical protein [Chlorogloeopsis sp. ULAP01]MDM9383820.1 hypothetical protein [Chlorogloeopsis sp. ULAP01]
MNECYQINQESKQILSSCVSQILSVNVNETENEQISACIKSISVTADGRVFGVNASNETFRYLGNNKWQMIGNIKSG